MSKIRLTGATSGYVEIKAAAVAGDKEVEVPNVSGGTQMVLAGSDGALPSPGLLNYVYLTTPGSGTYTPTAGTKRILVEVWGAGGGGGGVDGIATSGHWAKGGSGAGGGYCSKWIASNLAASYSYTVGAGGSGGSAGANDGSTGGSSTFSGTGVSLTANGGAGGIGNTAAAGGTVNYGHLGGSASGGDLNVQGGRSTGNQNYSRLDADSFAGVGWGFPVTANVGGQGSNGGSAGSAGINPSEGGAGAKVDGIATNYAGGNGGTGLIKITEYFL